MNVLNSQQHSREVEEPALELLSATKFSMRDGAANLKVQIE